MDTPSETYGETRDGPGPGGDHNADYTFGVRLTALVHPQFTTLQYARLLCLRSHVEDGARVPEVHVLANPARFGLRDPVIYSGEDWPAE